VLLLAIDTSTPTVTAGVLRLALPHELIAAATAATAATAAGPVTLLAGESVTDAFAHAERLMPLVNAALARAGQTLADLDAVVVGLGPGPFTGLRVGVATAAALGDALDIPVHGVGSHEGAAKAHLAAGIEPSGDFLVVTDARRREVYLSAYSAKGVRRFGPAPVAPAVATQVLTEAGVDPHSMIGAGTPLLADFVTCADSATAHPPEFLTVGLVLAAGVALLTGVVPGPLVPLYLRRPDATEPAARKSVLGR